MFCLDRHINSCHISLLCGHHEYWMLTEFKLTPQLHYLPNTYITFSLSTLKVKAYYWNKQVKLICWLVSSNMLYNNILLHSSSGEDANVLPGSCSFSFNLSLSNHVQYVG